MQAISILRKDTTSIIFLPLNKIAKRRSQEANQIGGRGILFHGKIKDMREEIQLAKEGHYTHIFINLQLASTSTFRDVLKDPGFQKRLAMIVLDEAHLIVQWREQHRPEYAQLRLGVGILVIKIRPRYIPSAADTFSTDHLGWSFGAVRA